MKPSAQLHPFHSEANQLRDVHSKERLNRDRFFELSALAAQRLTQSLNRLIWLNDSILVTEFQQADLDTGNRNVIAAGAAPSRTANMDADIAKCLFLACPQADPRFEVRLTFRKSWEAIA